MKFDIKTILILYFYLFVIKNYQSFDLDLFSYISLFMIQTLS